MKNIFYTTILSILFTVISSNLQAQEVIYIYPDESIQDAISIANNGDTIIIEEGEYYENLQIINKEITIGSKYIIDKNTDHIEKTIINGSTPENEDEGSVIAFFGNEHNIFAPRIIGLSITGGTGWKIKDTLSATDPTANDELTTIVHRVGAGLYINNMNPVFTKNIIYNNKITNSRTRFSKEKVGENEGGGLYSFMSVPNFGGSIGRTGIINEGENKFYNNFADVGKTFYIESNSNNLVINAQNCIFDVYNYSDKDISSYWAYSPGGFSFERSSGKDTAIVRDVFVSPNGSDTNDGLSVATSFKTISHALSKVYGNIEFPVVIHLEAGIYSPSSNGEQFPLQMVNWVTLSGAGETKTIINAEGDDSRVCRVLSFDNVEGAGLFGMKITGGFNYWNPIASGAGIYMKNSSPEITNVVISDNIAGSCGGGVFCFQNSNAKFTNVTISNNSANQRGGGICCYASHPIFKNVVIANNEAKSGEGGGIYCWFYTNIDLNNVIISGNAAKQSNGGGIYFNNSFSTLNNVRIFDNIALNGGAIYCNNSVPNILNSTFNRNTALNKGGGAYCINHSEAKFRNVKILNNEAEGDGGGVFCFASNVVFESTTISDNYSMEQGGGVYSELSGPVFINSVLWHNRPQEIYANSRQDGIFADTVRVIYSDIEGGQEQIESNVRKKVKWLDGNIDIDPLFNDPDFGDYSLHEESPMIDAGVAFFEHQGKIFINMSNTYYKGIAPDMGAIEYSKLTDINNIDTENNAMQIYPNPFSVTTTIYYQPKQTSELKLSIHDVMGRQIKVFDSKNTNNEILKFEWKGKDNYGNNVPYGIYFCKLQIGKSIHSVKLIYMK